MVTFSTYIFQEEQRETKSYHDYCPFRPGDTILIAAGGRHLASNIQINKPLCLVCADDLYPVMLFCL